MDVEVLINNKGKRWKKRLSNKRLKIFSKEGGIIVRFVVTSLKLHEAYSPK